MRRLLPLLTTLGALAWLAWQLWPRPAAMEAGVVACADWRRGCGFTIGGAPARLRFVDPPATLEPFRVRVEGAFAAPPTLTLSMRGMSMAAPAFRLQPAGGGWEGRAVLPVCTERRSDWLLALDDGVRQVRIAVTLPAVRPG